MFKLILSLILYSNISFAINKPDLINNFCRPKVDSKRYITNDFNGKFPRKITFECTYECMINNNLNLIPAISTIEINSIEEDAYKVVCQGVKVKKVPWGYDYDGYDSFYAFQTQLKNIKKFAFENIDQKNPIEQELLLKLKTELLIVSQSYIQAGSSNPGTIIGQSFLDAGNILNKIARDLPNNTSKLNDVIKSIVVQKGQIQKNATTQSLVESVIITSALWKIPTHLF